MILSMSLTVCESGFENERDGKCYAGKCRGTPRSP